MISSPFLVYHASFAFLSTATDFPPSFVFLVVILKSACTFVTSSSLLSSNTVSLHSYCNYLLVTKYFLLFPLISHIIIMINSTDMRGL